MRIPKIGGDTVVIHQEGDTYFALVFLEKSSTREGKNPGIGWAESQDPVEARLQAAQAALKDSREQNP